MSSAATIPSGSPFTAMDLRRLEAAGIAPEAAARQLELLARGATPLRLLRSCTRGDGIEILPDGDLASLAEEFRQACVEGKVVHFIPASGAATRMADSLEPLRKQGGMDERLAALFGGGETDLKSLPKALVPFHRYGDHIATPVEEHIREAAALAGPKGVTRLHFTMTPEHESRFRRHVDDVLRSLRSEGVRAEVTCSLQEPATQTLALDDAGLPFRDAEGTLVLRPGGHGALLPNLEACGGEFAWIRNIDNIAVEPCRAEGRLLRGAMAGKLIRLAREGKRGRPLRVCGMVPNTGEPGGGPFWVNDSLGLPRIRIVESPEVDPADPEQQARFRSATHFSPTDIICALRDSAGSPFRLREFSEPEACFVTGKTFAGRPLRALEWPGLWNGGMAYWDTHCVEMPLNQFAPVKTVLDLLRPEHQG